MSLISIVNGKTKTEVGVGVILDIETSFGKMSRSCISMALHDFYQEHDNHTTMIVPHFRDSKQNNVEAVSAVIDLLKNDQVMAILGPMTSSQAEFVIEIGNRSKVPIMSQATSPSLSTNDNPYFIRMAHDTSSQLQAIAELVKHFEWREVVFLYEDGEYGRSLYSDVMLTFGTKLMYHTVIYPSASDDWILKELYKLKTMQTRVFIVHALPSLASRFFKKVNEAGMMEEGYVWIITEGLTSRLHSLDRNDIDSMHGVLGVKSYIPTSNKLTNFERRWKRDFQIQNPDDDVTELDMFGKWTYDTVFALAMALEKVGNETNTSYQRQQESTTDFDAIGTSEMGPIILPWVRNISFKGLSGDFHVVNGQLQSSVYQIVNIIETRDNTVGYWTPRNSTIFKKLNHEAKGLRAITWPGDSHVVPKGWETPTSDDNVLRIGVPAKGGLVDEFIHAYTDPKTQQVIATGFCVDVFNAVVDALPYAVKYEFIPFVTGSYDDLLQNLSHGKYDAVVGDVTVLANRWDHVDFTLPFSEAGVAMIVPIKDERKSAWIFMKPLEKKLWITTGAFFIYTGLVVWFVEHRVNKEFRGPPLQHIGMIFWFSFSTLVFAHREKLISNLSRFVVIVWVFVVFVLTSSYTASLSSMLTVPQLRPTYTDISEIKDKGESIGYQEGSFVVDILKKMKFDDSKLQNYSNFEQMDIALKKGSQNGGVSAIVDERPYITGFLSKYCTNYTITGSIYKTAGFGFAFQKGSPLFPDFSRAVLQVTEEQMMNISKQWFGDASSCIQHRESTVTSDRLSLDSFKGLFLIAGLSSTSALLIFIFKFLYKNKKLLLSQGSVSQKLAAIVTTFDEFKDNESKKTVPEATVEELVGEVDVNNTPEISVFRQEAEVSSHDEGFSTTEPRTRVHHTILVVETTI
nr:glutamate receptor 2.8-like [Tanacetum cinerariifolium]